MESWTACTSVRVSVRVGALLTSANRCLRQISPPILIGPTTLNSLRRSGSAPAVPRPCSPATVLCWELLPCIIAIRTNPASTMQEALNAELAGAVDYVMSLLPRPITEERISADWFMTTSAQLGGDGLGYHWIDSERFAFYLLDVSGHGVKSALLAVSIIDTLRTCGLADTDWKDPGAVLGALNRVYFSQSHDHLYFTIWYGIADMAKRILRYSGGGHPPAVIRAARCENHKLGASGPPVGCFANAKYPTVDIPLRFPTDLYPFSDGVFETRRRQDAAPLDRLVDFLVAPSNGQGWTVAEIRNRTLEHLHGALPP